MDYRAVLLCAGIYGGVTAACLFACNAPDPASITFSVRPASPTDTTPAATATGTGTAAPTGDGGVAVTADPIFGTEALVWQDPGVVANNQDPAHNGTVEGKDCIVAGCHLDNNDKWMFAGTLYTTNAGTTTATKGQVRVIGPDGGIVGETYTDANGNFWVSTVGDIPQGSMAGARVTGGKTTQHMTTLLGPTNKGCNQAGANCHGTAVTGKIFAN